MTATPSYELVCSIRPTSVSENATFLIDVDTVRFTDLKSDDMGSWKSTGTKSVYFSIREGHVYFATVTERGELYHVLTRRYYIHSTYQLYKRIIVDIRGMYMYAQVIFCTHLHIHVSTSFAQQYGI